MAGTLATYWKEYKALSPWFAMACYMATLALWGALFLDSSAERFSLLSVVVPIGMVLDYFLHRAQTGRPNIESSLITSAIVAVLLPPDVSLFVAAAAIVLAIGSKHFLLYEKRHILNPAAFGVAVTAAVFGFGLGWWPDSFVWLTVAFGLLNVWRVRKFPQVISFTAVYLVLTALFATFPAGSLLFDGLGQQTLPVALPWFFMFFMLPEPVTSLQPRTKQIIFGAVVAAVGFAVTYVPTLDAVAILWGLLAGNLYARLAR